MGVVGIELDRFMNMTWGEYILTVYNYNYTDLQRMKKLRMLISCWTSKSPHEVMELPGDFEAIQKRVNQLNQEQIKNLAQKWGVGHWINNN